ncbi:ribonuclease P [Haloglomus irregulare]|jgi:ribonuclease P protein subunit POP4|uniref:Ribonuclease P protein component 1 n=2 Tax=Haloglomus irregulare TaxID=2234134 RepID=A0A554NF32_9EURY|nr:ribonuclease P [Haloglomus irregulare]
MPTPETLPRHELIGLPVRVADATHDGYVGLGGRVVDETTRTLAVDGSGTGVRQVPKAAATFEFRLPGTGDDAPAHGARGADQFVTVAGERLVARPARRTEHRGDSIWR